MRRIISCGAEIAAAPALARPPLALPLREPATMAPAPSSMAMIIWVCARAICSRIFARWPPARCPVSCASTPMIWFGVSDCSTAPWLTKMRRPSATKALKAPSLRMTIWMFCFSSPAARRIGRVYSRSNCSDSVSLITRRPRSCSAHAGTTGATMSAAAVARAVSFETFLRIARRSNIQVFVIGGGRHPGYALTNGGIRLVWGTKRNSRYRCWKRHLETAQRGWCRPRAGAMFRLSW